MFLSNSNEHIKDYYMCLNCNERADALYQHTEGQFIKLIKCVSSLLF